MAIGGLLDFAGLSRYMHRLPERYPDRLVPIV